MNNELNTKSIICLNPHKDNNLNLYDTGLGNRIIHWAVGYYISTLYEGCKVIVDKNWWPELEFLDLPNTEVFDLDLNHIKNSCIRLSPEDLLNIINNKKQNIFENNSSPYYYDNFSFFGIVERFSKVGMSKIKFKNDKVNQFFKNNFSNFCSIHLRRGIGTNPTVGFIKEFLSYKNRKELNMYLTDYYFNNSYSNKMDAYDIIPDKVYFLAMDEIILQNKFQKFYISADVPEDYYSYYYDRYPNNIVSRNRRARYLNEFLSFFDCSIIKDVKKINQSHILYSERNLSGNHKKINNKLKDRILIDLFDIFVLSHSPMLIGTTGSTWFLVAWRLSFIDDMGRPNKLEKHFIDILSHTLERDSISPNEFVKKYAYYRPGNKILEKN